MPTFSYIAYDKRGKTYEGDIEAPTESDALVILAKSECVSKSIVYIDIRLKTVSEVSADKRLANLRARRDRLLGVEQQRSMQVDYAPVSPPSTRWIDFLILLLLVAVAIVVYFLFF